MQNIKKKLNLGIMHFYSSETRTLRKNEKQNMLVRTKNSRNNLYSDSGEWRMHPNEEMKNYFKKPDIIA